MAVLESCPLRSATLDAFRAATCGYVRQTTQGSGSELCDLPGHIEILWREHIDDLGADVRSVGHKFPPTSSMARWPTYLGLYFFEVTSLAANTIMPSGERACVEGGAADYAEGELKPDGKISKGTKKRKAEGGRDGGSVQQGPFLMPADAAAASAATRTGVSRESISASRGDESGALPEGCKAMCIGTSGSGGCVVEVTTQGSGSIFLTVSQSAVCFDSRAMGALHPRGGLHKFCQLGRNEEFFVWELPRPYADAQRRDGEVSQLLGPRGGHLRWRRHTHGRGKAATGAFRAGRNLCTPATPPACAGTEGEDR